MAKHETLSGIWKGIRQLNPDRPVREAAKPFTTAISGTEEEAAALREMFFGTDTALADSMITGGRADLIITPGDAPINAFLDRAEEKGLLLSVGRHLPLLRPFVVKRVVKDVSMENAVVAVTTAIGSVLPTPLLPLIGIAETASDMVILTGNQVRMLFILGAIYGEPVGYVHQWREISSIVGAAFGWRSLARALVGMIPFGAGLLPKGAVAYAGTTAVGEGIIFFYTTGRHMTGTEAREAFKNAYSAAGDVVRSLAGKAGSGKASG